MEEEGLLLYCIVNHFDENNNSFKGIDDIHPICAIEYKGLFGIYSKVYLNEYSEENLKIKGEDIKWLTEKACKFMNILQLLSGNKVSIPMKFLTLFNNENRLRDALSENYHLFNETLNSLRDCEEHSVKIYCDVKHFKETAMNAEITAFAASLFNKPKGAAFFLKKKFDIDLDNKVEKKIFASANSIIETVKPYCKELKSNKLLAKEITCVQEKMILNCAVLINQTQIDEFQNSINQLKENYQDCGIIIECSGPWPPYNFC